MNVATASDAEYIYSFTGNPRDGVAIDSDNNLIGPRTLMTRYGVDAATLCLAAGDEVPSVTAGDWATRVGFAASDRKRTDTPRLRAWLASHASKTRQIERLQAVIDVIEEHESKIGKEGRSDALLSEIAQMHHAAKYAPSDHDLSDIIDAATKKVIAGMGGAIKAASLADDMAGDYGR